VEAIIIQHLDLELKKELSEILVRIGALKFGAFTLTGGRLSSYYIDMRIIPSFPGAFRKVGEIYIAIAKKSVGEAQFKRVVGIPTAGIPFASIVAFSLAKPFLYVRREAKTYGRQRKVEGILHPGDSVLPIDDLITSGGSLLSAVDCIKAEGGVVKDALVLIDREEGGEKALAKAGIKLHSGAKISEIAEILGDMEIISEDQVNAIREQIKK
jgi:orotate phosphoribosyltransferase